MFYSHLLLSNKGALGTVWVAAHCYNKLKKSQVQETDISTSVDKILVDEVPVVAHRILAYLLLGVVRIYSKKVEYLFDDCNDVLSKLCELNIEKKARAGSSASRPRQHSISLPKRFELDTFDLGLVGNRVSRRKKVRPSEEVIRTDARGEEGSTSGLPNEENISSSEAHSTAYTPPRDVLSPHHEDQDHLMSSLLNANNSTESVEILRGTSFALEDRMEPMMLDETEEEQMHDKTSNRDNINLHWLNHDVDHDSVAGPSHTKNDSPPSLDIFHGMGFSLDDRMEPMVLDEAEEEQMNGMPSGDNNSPVASLETMPRDIDTSLENCQDPVTNVEHSPRPPIVEVYRRKEKAGCTDDTAQQKVADVFDISSEADEPRGLPVAVDNERPASGKKMKFPDMVTPESRIRHRNKHSMAISVDVTPETKLAEAGAGTPDFAAVETPALQEQAKFSRKRKSSLDRTTMLPADSYRDWLNDTGDLKRKRRTVPHTALQTWKAHKLSNIPQSLLETSIPGIPIDLESLARKMDTRASSFRPTNSVAGEVSFPVTHKDREITPEVGTLVTFEGEIPDIGSAESITSDAGPPQVTSHIAHEDEMPDMISAEGKTPDVRPAVDQRSPEQTSMAPGTPVTNVKSLRLHETEALADSDNVVDTSSLDIIEKQPFPSEELEFDEINSPEGDSVEEDTFSARTRMVAMHLHKKFLYKKRQKEDEVLNLSQLLLGKTKKESARLFYETLVLKTRDCVDVQQEVAYGDVLLRETSKLKSSLNLDS